MHGPALGGSPDKNRDTSPKNNEHNQEKNEKRQQNKQNEAGSQQKDQNEQGGEKYENQEEINQEETIRHDTRSALNGLRGRITEIQTESQGAEPQDLKQEPSQQTETQQKIQNPEQGENLDQELDQELNQELNQALAGIKETSSIGPKEAPSFSRHDTSQENLSFPTSTDRLGEEIEEKLSGLDVPKKVWQKVANNCKKACRRIDEDNPGRPKSVRESQQNMYGLVQYDISGLISSLPIPSKYRNRLIQYFS